MSSQNSKELDVPFYLSVLVSQGDICDFEWVMYLSERQYLNDIRWAKRSNEITALIEELHAGWGKSGLDDSDDLVSQEVEQFQVGDLVMDAAGEKFTIQRLYVYEQVNFFEDSESVFVLMADVSINSSGLDGPWLPRQLSDLKKVEQELGGVVIEIYKVSREVEQFQVDFEPVANSNDGVTINEIFRPYRYLGFSGLSYSGRRRMLIHKGIRNFTGAVNGYSTF